MKLRLILLSAILVTCFNIVSALFIPLVTTGAGTAGTLTVTTSAASVASGVAGAAAAGFVGLGLAGLLLSQGGGADNDHRHYGYHSRHRRSAVKKAIEILSLKSNVDVNTCDLKMVCQIFQKPGAYLTKKELAIVLLVGQNPKPALIGKLKDPQAPYESAAILGLRGGNCNYLYSTCPLTDEEIHLYLDNIQLEGDKNFSEVVRSSIKG